MASQLIDRRANRLIEQIATEDLSKALRDGWRRRISGWLTRKHGDLLSFNEISETLQCKSRHKLGLQMVPIDHIVGSLGRCCDFDRAFYPRRGAKPERWIRIAKAYYQEIELPPVELYKVGGTYFVVDGNHRISVARTRGQLFIDAYVTEIDVA